jgi:hypothetical protein
MEDKMDILHIEKKGPFMSTLERFSISSLSKDNLHVNDTYIDTYNPIFDLVENHYGEPIISLQASTQLNSISTPTPKTPQLQLQITAHAIIPDTSNLSAAQPHDNTTTKENATIITHNSSIPEPKNKEEKHIKRNSTIIFNCAFYNNIEK